MTDPSSVDFQRNAVQPIECLRAGWDLIKSQYWLFLGITAVGMIIGSLVPLGILMGPMMCGIYLALFQTRRGQPIEFGILFKGFDYFGDAVVAALLHLIPVLIIFVPSYILFYVALFMMLPQSGGSQPNPAMFFGMFGFFVLFWLVIILVLLIISVGFTFAYPLIVDRRLSGLNAVKLSIRAAMANFWRLLGLLLLNGVFSFVGVLLCYVGVLFVLPVTFAAIAKAYEQVFGLGDVQPNLPPPPPTFT